MPSAPITSESHLYLIDASAYIFRAYHALPPLTPLRKPGKLPWQTYSERYELEYGSDELHMHVDALTAADKVLLVDDLIATGGTAEAGLKLLRRTQADIVAAAFLIDLPDLGGAARLRKHNIAVTSLMQFPGH